MARTCDDSELIRREARLSCVTQALYDTLRNSPLPPPEHISYSQHLLPLVGPLHQTRSDRSGSLHGCRFALIRYFGVNPSLCSLTVAPNQVKQGSLRRFIPSACAAVQKNKKKTHNTQDKNKAMLTDVRKGMV